MCEDEIASLDLIVAGEAASHGHRGGGFAVYEGSEPQPPVAAYFAESLTIS
jgi:hypothetical protein